MLTLPAQIQGHEMAQVVEGHLAAELQLEGNRPAAIGPGQLPNLHHQIAGFRPGVDEFASHREVVVSFRQGIGRKRGSFRCRLLPLHQGIGGSQGARLPNPHHLEMELVLVAAAGVHHPEMGQLQVEVATHQGEQAAEHHRLQFAAIGGADHPAGGLGRIARYVVATHHTDGPILHRLGDRGNGVGAHGGGENARQGRSICGQCSQHRR